MKNKILENKTMIVSIILLGAMFIYSFSMGVKASIMSGEQFIIMLKIVPPIFIMIGLLDVWVPKETMMKIMGEKSGAVGILIAFLFGTFAAGPLVAAFPIAVVMLKKGARYANVLFFLTIWASAKLPIILFEIQQLGLTFTLVSNITLIIVYLIGSYVIEKILGEEYIKNMVDKMEGSD